MSNRIKMKKKWKIIYGFVIAVYVFELLQILIFKYLDNPLQLITGNHMDYSGMNLILFKDIWDANVSDTVNRTAIVGNIILFVPIPILYNILVKEDWKKPLILSFGLSLIVEITQYVFKIGIFDVNDILLNTLGGVVGIIIYKLIKVLFSRKDIKKVVGVLGGITGVVVATLETLIHICN